MITNIVKTICNHGLDWYVVFYNDNTWNLHHRIGMSCVLECGHDPADYDILDYIQCDPGCDPDEVLDSLTHLNLDLSTYTERD